MAEDGSRNFSCRYAKAPTDELDGIRYARIRVAGGQAAEDPGSAKQLGGPYEVQRTRQRIEVELYGTNPNTMRTLSGAAAANLIIGYKGAAGANGKHTIKNVVFTEFLGDVEIRDPDTGGTIPVVGARGVAEWGADDTLALMWVSAADA